MTTNLRQPPARPLTISQMRDVRIELQGLAPEDEDRREELYRLLLLSQEVARRDARAGIQRPA